MFKAMISNVDLIKDSISTIGELIDEGIFKVSKNGLNLIAADRAMVAVVDFKLPATIFEEFNVEGEKNIPINITNLVSVLKRTSSNDKVILDLKDNKLEITMKGDSIRKFTVPLLDIAPEEIPSIDQLDFKSKVKIKGDVLKSGIEDAEVVADSVVFESGKDMFSMRASGDISSAELVLKKDDKSLLEIKATDSTRARYPLDYLKKMIKATKLADDVVLMWSKDYPMKLSFKDVDKVELNFILAPRVQEE
jgi:proliferating cell nuclear antigen